MVREIERVDLESADCARENSKCWRNAGVPSKMALTRRSNEQGWPDADPNSDVGRPAINVRRVVSNQDGIRHEYSRPAMKERGMV